MIRPISTTIFIFAVNSILSAQKIEKIQIPEGIVYNYCDVRKYEEAKLLILQNLDETEKNDLLGNFMIVGPVLWQRYEKIKSLNEISGGYTTLIVDNLALKAKLTQNADDAKKVWDEFKKEIQGHKVMLRKANPRELRYYWTVISFDIEEPLIILETDQTAYILNINPQSMKLNWLDQVPAE